MNYPLETYRYYFPHIHTGKIWLNHATISPLSSRVKKTLHAHIENRSAGDIDVYPSVLASVQKTKMNLASLINASPERIGFAANTSEGLNILTNGLEWKSGDRIILNDSEFPTNVVPFLNLKRFGVEIDFIQNIKNEIRIEDIEQKITPRTKLLSISFVQFLSGFKADLAEIGKLCKRHNIIFCVDSIQGLGAVPLDVKEMQIDFLSNGGNKWLMGLMGLGFVFVTEELQKRIRQTNVGWTSNKNFFGDFFNYRIDLDDTARRYENGTQNYSAIAALGESTSLLLEAGIENIYSHLLSLTDTIIAFADENNFEIVTPREKNKRAGIITLTHPRAKEIFDDLTEQRVIISMREGMLRIAPHFYSSQEDLNVLFSILRYYNE